MLFWVGPCEMKILFCGLSSPKKILGCKKVNLLFSCNTHGEDQGESGAKCLEAMLSFFTLKMASVNGTKSQRRVCYKISTVRATFRFIVTQISRRYHALHALVSSRNLSQKLTFCFSNKTLEEIKLNRQDQERRCAQPIYILLFLYSSFLCRPPKHHLLASKDIGSI